MSTKNIFLRKKNLFVLDNFFLFTFDCELEHNFAFLFSSFFLFAVDLLLLTNYLSSRGTVKQFCLRNQMGKNNILFKRNFFLLIKVCLFTIYVFIFENSPLELNWLAFPFLFFAFPPFDWRTRNNK